MPYPDALKGNPKIIFFTDFDGTITLSDSRSASPCTHRFLQSRSNLTLSRRSQ